MIYGIKTRWDWPVGFWNFPMEGRMDGQVASIRKGLSTDRHKGNVSTHHQSLTYNFERVVTAFNIAKNR
jgi:hypothetical protein